MYTVSIMSEMNEVSRQLRPDDLKCLMRGDDGNSSLRDDDDSSLVTAHASMLPTPSTHRYRSSLDALSSQAPSFIARRKTAVLAFTLTCILIFLLFSDHSPLGAPTHETLSDEYDVFHPPIPTPTFDYERPPFLKPIPPVPEKSNVTFPSLNDWPLVKIKSVTERSRMVKEAFLHSWRGYEKYAFGADELRPLTNKSVDNFAGWGVSIVDALDTMYIMELEPEFKRGVEHVTNMNMTFPEEHWVSFFEVVIRYIGGFLGAYTVSREPALLEKADTLGWELLRAFETDSGLPLRGLVPPSGNITSKSWSSTLAEIASLQMEFKLLSRLTGRKEYAIRAEHINEVLRRTQESNGLWSTSWSIPHGNATQGHYTIGALADSAYEYLLKQYLLSGGTEPRLKTMYMRAIRGVLSNMLFLTPGREFLYVTDLYGSMPTRRFEHLSCFLPGLLALGAKLLPYEPDIRKHRWAALGLSHSCAAMYEDTPTGLGPEETGMLRWSDMHARYGSEDGRWGEIFDWWMSDGERSGAPPGCTPPPKFNINNPTHRIDYTTIKPLYLLRPETLESIYVMWRTTHEEIWREKAWNIFLSIEKYARGPSGHASLAAIDSWQPHQINEMPSYAFAETWKYLYLIFLDEDPLPMDKWVFNTEAHPFPIFKWSSNDKKKFGIP